MTTYSLGVLQGLAVRDAVVVWPRILPCVRWCHRQLRLEASFQLEIGHEGPVNLIDSPAPQASGARDMQGGVDTHDVFAIHRPRGIAGSLNPLFSPGMTRTVPPLRQVNAMACCARALSLAAPGTMCLMGIRSILRLPEDLEQKLSQEASLSGPISSLLSALRTARGRHRASVTIERTQLSQHHGRRSGVPQSTATRQASAAPISAVPPG